MFGWWSSPTTQGMVSTGEKNSGKDDITAKSAHDQSDNGELGEKTNASSVQQASDLEDKQDKHSELDFAKDMAKNVGSKCHLKRIKSVIGVILNLIFCSLTASPKIVFTTY